MQRKTKPSANTVIGLDIGSTEITAVLCELTREKQIRLLGKGYGVSSGISRGWITDPIELATSIDRVLERMMMSAGVRCRRIVSNVPLAGSRYVLHSGFLMPPSGQRVFTQEDKIEVIRRSKNVEMSTDEMLMHTLPLDCRIDGTSVSDPVGDSGASLEVCSGLMFGYAETISLLRQSLRSIDMVVAGLIYGGLSLAEVVLSDTDRDAGAIVIDIGGRFTNVSVFQHGVMQGVAICPIGGETITSDLAQCLDISIPEAERLKHHALTRYLSSPDGDIQVAQKHGGKKSVALALVWQIVAARLKELCGMISKSLVINLPENRPIFLLGGCRNMSGLDRFLTPFFHREIRLDMANSDVIDGDARYGVAFGSICYGVKSGAISYPDSRGLLSIKTSVKEWFSRLR